MSLSETDLESIAEGLFASPGRLAAFAGHTWLADPMLPLEYARDLELPLSQRLTFFRLMRDKARQKMRGAAKAPDPLLGNVITVEDCERALFAAERAIDELADGALVYLERAIEQTRRDGAGDFSDLVGYIGDLSNHVQAIEQRLIDRGLATSTDFPGPDDGAGMTPADIYYSLND